MKKGLFNLILCVLSVLTVSIVQTAEGASTTRAQAVTEIKNWKTQNTQKLQELDARIRSLLTHDPAAALNMTLNESEIEVLTKSRKELLTQQELIDRLLLQVDTRFKDGDLRLFLADRLSEMAKADLLDDKNGQMLWRQMTYLSQALRELPERSDNVVSFIAGYLKQSPFSNPLKPSEFGRNRQYTNGYENVAATPVDKDEVGDLVEDKIQKLENPENP